MSAQLSIALDEICLKGSSGISLDSLWVSLSSIQPITRSTKHHLWNSLRAIPTLLFYLAHEPVSPADPRIQRVEDVEGQNLRIAASDRLRDCFLGLYDVSSSELPANQRHALERIALAREKGITQSQLGKEFGIEGTNLFYIVKKLETRGLIVRQQAVVKTLETAGGVEEAKNVSCVTTNLIYLHRYAKRLTGLQRLEINKEAGAVGKFDDEESDFIGDECVKDDVSVKDYLPEMRSICEKLEHAPGKVLVVRDLKRDLNYSGCFGHRAWRNIRNRLKESNLIEEFDGRVNGKVTRCLRLLKSMPSSKNQCDENGCDNNNVMKFGRKAQLSEQTLELAIDHQVYDVIDGEGSKGALLFEVCGKLGLDRKKNDNRLNSIVKRFGMHKQEEGHKKTGVYRVWTSEYKNSASSALLKNIKNPISNTRDFDASVEEQSRSISAQDADLPISMENKQNSTHAPDVCVPNGSKDVPNERNAESRKSSSRALININGALREQRILERLKEDKYLLRSELPRWLCSLEKDKTTSMDRKTVDRILTRLENQGICKRVRLNIPAVGNCGKIRSSIVILDQSVQNSLPELSSQILERLRSFEREVNSNSSKNKTDESVPVLDIERIKSSVPNEGKRVQTDANHTPLAKMARAKLLHRFLWNYVRGLPVWDEALPETIHLKNYKPFSFEAAQRDLPVDLLFLIVGSPSLHDKMSAKICAGGFRLSDLTIDEYRHIMDANVVQHLSRVLEILRRLKLIRLIHDKHENAGEEVPSVNFTHALEMNPYIEEPPSMIEMRVSRSNDLRPRIRHDFVLQNGDVVDEYWNTLEYCYAASDSKAARNSFPGSIVPEVSHHRSWTSIKGLSEHHHSEILKSMSKKGLKEKMSFEECEKFARDLNITLHQVLTVYYGKCRAVSNNVANQGGSCSFKDLQRSKRKCLPFTNTSRKVRKCENAADQSTDGDSLEACESSAPSICPSKIKQDEDDKSAESLRVLWTDEADRYLVTLYARCRATMGATTQRVDWTKIDNLPAKARICAKRMCYLKRNGEFRKALMKFCTFLSQRYAKDLEALHCDSDEKRVNNHPSKTSWDDFNDESVKKALEDVLLHKKIAKPANLKIPKLPLESFDLQNRSDFPSDYPFREVLNTEDRQHDLTDVCNLDHQFAKQLYSSLAISNAVELLKLIFLKSTASSELELGITDILRNYSEHDLFAGFSYLRDKKIVIGGTGGPFVLSQQFVQRLQRSPFPPNTGKRASQFSDWIDNNAHQSTEGVLLSSDLECGDIFHLFSLVCSGEFSISPCLPEKGVGEAEDRRNGKRKSEDGESPESERAKKVKFFNENDPSFRREKGFPGITVSIHRNTLSPIDTLRLDAKCVERDSEVPDMNTVKTTANLPSASCWEGMVNYMIYMHKSDSGNPKITPNCDAFKSIYTEVQKAGDQGLEMKQIEELLPSPSNNYCEEIVETLIAFQRVIKVNSFDSLRIVDALYRPKYFISYGNEQRGSDSEESELATVKNDNDLHKVTFLNGPRSDSPPKLEENLTSKAQSPILPWLNGDGSVNKRVYAGLIRRVMGIVMQSPGILEGSIIEQVDALNPQSCRCLLDSMILDDYVIVKKMHQSVFCGGSSLLQSIVKSDVKEEEIVYRKHYFGNCKFSCML